MKLNLYSISDRYIRYLRKFDDRIYDNKEEIKTYKRKYLGVVLTINELNYYIPMSSPKKSDYINWEKKIIRKDTKTIMRIRIGQHLYGTLRISNMIPVPITELDPYVVSEEKDQKYKEVVLGELRYINNNSNKIIKYAKIVYEQKMKDIDISYKQICSAKSTERVKVDIMFENFKRNRKLKAFRSNNVRCVQYSPECGTSNFLSSTRMNACVNNLASSRTLCLLR